MIISLKRRGNKIYTKDKNQPRQVHSRTELFEKEHLGSIQYIGNILVKSPNNNHFSLNIAMSEMCQDLAVTSHKN